jgi:two-component system LytT family response regulator
MPSMASDSQIRALIVDDESPARSRIRQLLRDEADFKIIGECANGREAIETIKQQKPDVVFLDVQMPGLSGIDVCHAISADSNPPPLLVFVTAYDQFAVKAFEVHAIDYLLKPFDRERFKQALCHIRQQIQKLNQGGADSRLAALLGEFNTPQRNNERLVFKENGRVVFIKTDTIDWIESDGNYVRMHAGESAHYFRDTLSGLETQLPAGKFMRISRSTIVNLDRIKEMQPLFYGDYLVVLQNGSKLNMSRTYRDRLEAILPRRD